MRLSRRSRNLLRAAVAVVLAFIYIPLVVIAIYAFNSSNLLEWPPPSLTLHWFPEAIKDGGARDAFFTSLKVGAAATGIALLLGTLASLAVAKHRFFGRETVSFLLVLPIALPGIVTGIALNSAFVAGNVTLSTWTIIVGHATFCIVVVFNNVVARLRRTPTSLVEASMDLGADGWQTFRMVTLPAIRTALVAGALLAFGLSFDEIVVTNFTAGPKLTLPIWIYNHIRTPTAQPIVNAVALVLMIVSIVPVYLAQRLTEGGTESVSATIAGGSTPGR